MKIAVLAEQNFNLIDGSTIWLLNVCKLLARQEDFGVTLLLSHKLENPVLADELPEDVQVIDPGALGDEAEAARLTGDTLPGVLAGWEARHGAFERILVRGPQFLESLLGDARFAGRVVAYSPGVIGELPAPDPAWIGAARAGRVPLIVQSEPAKRAMESLHDYPAHVVHVVPPIAFSDGPPVDRDRAGVTLCYSGKIDLHYGLDWLIDIARAIGERPGLGIDLIAGKDTYRARHPAFFRQMDAFRDAIGSGELPGVSLVTGLAHSDAKARMGQADFAYCLRHARYDDVIEISTKIVEFCSLGVPPLLNDNALNRGMFGDDYPYLIDPEAQDIETRVLDILSGRGGADHARAIARIGEVAAGFSVTVQSGRLARAIRGHDAGAPALSETPRRILIATHERKFLRQFSDRLQGDPGVSLTWQDWESTTKPGTRPTVPPDIDTVFCEWCCENAVWHSHNKRDGTRLIVRLHRFEAFRDFPARVDWGNVDRLIVVSQHFRDLMVTQHGVDPDRIHVAPQYIDWHELQRPKLPEARHTIGLVGINPWGHKRFDRAIDLFAALRARDSRFTLAVRSAMPWKLRWVWDNQEENRDRYVALFQRIFSDPLLKDAVRFDPPGPDMEEWYRGIGTILSSSDSEGCHTAVLEGMASGALPVVYDWPGAQALFAPYVHADLAAAIPGIIAFADDPDSEPARQDLAQRAKKHDIDVFVRDFMRL